MTEGVSSDETFRDTVPEPAGVPPLPRHRWPLRPEEPDAGPVAMVAAGPWIDSAPTSASPPPEHPPGPRWANAAWLALAAVAVLVLSVAAGLALGPRQTNGRPPAGGTAVREAAAQSPPRPVTGTAVGTSSAAADPAQQPPVASAPAAPFTVTYEAEANALSGGAFVASYRGASGGRIVQNLGDWKGTAGPGSLTFTDVVVPAAGRYTLTFYYVHVNGDPTRTVMITVSGSDPIAVTVSGGSACCARQAVDVHLAAGRNAVTFGNPQGPAPAIDKIVIGRATAA